MEIIAVLTESSRRRNRQKTGHIIADEIFSQFHRWLELEADAEAEQIKQRREKTRTNAEKSGDTLLDLVVSEATSGLGGRALLTLVKRNRTLSLPWNRLRPGTPILLTCVGDGEYQSGVVVTRRTQQIEVAVDAFPEGERFRIDLAPDEVTRQRQTAALRDILRSTGRTAELRDVLLESRAPQYTEPPQCTFTATLNPSQKEAIEFALSAEDVAIIHGPPGTGKTTTVVELIGQEIDRGAKVLACAPSNTAVDNLLERLIAAKRKVVRIGHPARVSEQLRNHTLDVQAANHELMSLAREMQREATGLFRRADRFTRAKPAYGAKQEMRREARELNSHARMLEQQAVNTVLDQADVICATTSFNEEMLGGRRFDLLVIDEACQSIEPGCWIPLKRADRVVLAGDHHQLPPTILSSQAAREGLAISLLERLVNHYGDTITRRLNTQYRMHTDIMSFSSDQFYDGTLEADSSVATHLLGELPGVTAFPLIENAVTFIDTAGADWHEELEPERESRRNPKEATLVLQKVDQLQEAGVRLRDIAVITPYAAQVRWLRDQWSGGRELEIDTVDGIQGREKEAVLISCVRSNPTGEIGFLADTRRMNVALTRARRKLIVVGDSATLCGHQYYAEMLTWIESLGAYQSVWEQNLDL